MIEIRNLTKRFSNETLITYRDMTFEDGKSYVLLGASGCGKSTLLNLIAGVLLPTTGQILIDGRDMTAASQAERDQYRIRNIGYIFQDFKLIEDMTVADNIGILRLEHIDVSDMDKMLDELGMLDKKKKKVRCLSGGEKQRVAVARANVKHPALILADEPTGNLNYTTGEAVVRQMLAVTRGKTLIAVTHDERLKSEFDVVIDMNTITSSRDLTEEEVENHVSVRN